MRREPTSLNLIPLLGEGGHQIYIKSDNYATLLTPIVISNLTRDRGTHFYFEVIEIASGIEYPSNMMHLVVAYLTKRKGNMSIV